MNYVKSDIGSKAAWKGFSSQTTYIAYRLMLLNDQSDFYPEKVEDLMVKNSGSIIELVQIKNLGNNLALSDFSPQEADSFFRRALANRKENEDFTLKVVSFGKIGGELQGFINNDETHIANIKNKLLKYKYSLDEIEWIFTNLFIIQVDESNLEKDIMKILGERIETMAAPQVAFDTLISYVSDLSRYSMHTSKEKWDRRIDAFVRDIVAIKGMCSQYGRTIINLNDYKALQSDEELAVEYKLGVNAHPQHIRNNLDIVREEWLVELNDSYKDNNIVIVKGASGQGKSSLAYRYLINNYIENYVFVIEKIVDSQQAIDIVSALNGLSNSRLGNIIVYMDVSPYDTGWLWIVEEINRRGIKLKLLITLREEDFNRTDIDLNKIKAKVIELCFKEYEARKIFDKYNSPSFLNFEQAWERFSETGPFMEFMYLLNQADTLKNKLESQINKVISNEPNGDEWLDILQVICYVGKNNLKINLQKLLRELPCKQTRKMLKQFEKEYLVKISNNNQYVECLHAVRAEVLYDILSQSSMMDEEATLLHAINSTGEFFQSMLVKYFYNHRNIDGLISKLTQLNDYSWTGYASVLSALLWLDTYRFYLTNKKVIDNGDSQFAGNFILLIGDATGYFDYNSTAFIDVIAKTNPIKAEKMRESINGLAQNKIDYQYTDIFIDCIKNKLSTNEILPMDNLSEVGFVLFWVAQRNTLFNSIYYEHVVKNLSNYPVESILDFLVGIQAQNQKEIYESIASYLVPIVCQRHNIIRLNIEENFIEADFIPDLFTEDLDEKSIEMHQKVMLVVDTMRRLFFKKDRYQVKAIGTDIIPNLELPDIRKNISSRNLPLVWITQMNAWLNKINDFEKRPDNWNDFRETVIKNRHTILTFSESVSDAISYMYKKDGNISRFTSSEYRNKKLEIEQMSPGIYKTPKSVNDRYGLTVSKNKVQLTDPLRKNEQNSTDKDIVSYVNKYVSSFTNFYIQMESLIVSRYKREETNETARLSLINLVESVLELGRMENLYTETFLADEATFNTDDEYEQLLLLSVMWEYLYNNKIRKESSVLYNCKEIIKQSRGKIMKFFDQIIWSYTDQEVIKNNSKVYLSLPATLIDDFSEQLFIHFKKEFPDMRTLSVESLFLGEYANEIIITIPGNDSEVIGGIKINLNNLISCQEVEKFLLYRLPIDKREIDAMGSSSIDNDDIMLNAYKVVGNLNALSLFYNHTTSVMKYIKSFSEDTVIQENVLYNWLKKGAELHRTVIKDIINSLEKIESVVPVELNKAYLTILSEFKDYKDLSGDIVKSEDVEQLNNVLNKVFEAVTLLLDRCILRQR